MVHIYDPKTDKVEINVFSALNTWMDATFTVNQVDEYRADMVLEKAWNSYLDDPEAECECYGDWLCRAMDEAGIQYEVRFTEEDYSEDDITDECWDEVVKRELAKEETA